MPSDQAFHIRRFFTGMQPQKMVAGLKSNRKIHLMDMLAFLFLKCNLPCYIRTEIKKYDPRPYFMGNHLPAFCVEIHGGYRVFERAERSFNSPSEAVYFLDFFRMEFVFGKICYDIFICAVPDGETDDAQGYFVFPVPLGREIVKGHLLADVPVLACRFRMQVFLF